MKNILKILLFSLYHILIFFCFFIFFNKTKQNTYCVFQDDNNATIFRQNILSNEVDALRISRSDPPTSINMPPVKSLLLSELFSGVDSLNFADLSLVDLNYPHTNIKRGVVEAIIGFWGKPIYFWVEAGSMLGNSAIFTSQILTDSGHRDASIVCIDTFLGDVNMWSWDADIHRKGQWSFLGHKQGHPTIFLRFLANIAASNYSHMVLPIPTTAIVGFKLLMRLHNEKRLDSQPEVVYLDSAHEQGETLIELVLAWETLASGGVLFGDDYSWPGVRHDVQQFASSVSGACPGIKGLWVNDGPVLVWMNQWILCKV